MFAVRKKSEENFSPLSQGQYFFDISTNKIKLKFLQNCEEINGTIHREYLDEFIPFFVEHKEGRCQQNNFLIYVFKNGDRFDKKLLEYVKEYPDSYVALWQLIERFHTQNYKNIYEDILNTFSTEIKSERLWKLINEDINNVEIRIGKNFPKLTLKKQSKS